MNPLVELFKQENSRKIKTVNVTILALVWLATQAQVDVKIAWLVAGVGVLGIVTQTILDCLKQKSERVANQSSSVVETQTIANED